MAQVVEEMTHSISQSEAFLQHLQQVRGSMRFLLGSSHKGAFSVCLGPFSSPCQEVSFSVQIEPKLVPSNMCCDLLKAT